MEEQRRQNVKEEEKEGKQMEDNMTLENKNIGMRRTRKRQKSKRKANGYGNLMKTE